MQRVQTRNVMLEATHAINLGRGIVLPSGYHLPATETRTGLETVSGGVSWTPPRYTIEFTADELVSMGAPDTENLISDEIDVTKFVRSGELTVT
jgi:hypothetical protein